MKIFPSSFKCLYWNTCFQKIKYQVPGCHINRTGCTKVLTKCFGTRNAGNTHAQWRRGSVSLCSVNSCSLLNTNYMLYSANSLGEEEPRICYCQQWNQAHDDAVQDSRSLSMIFKPLLVPCVGAWHWETAFLISKNTNVPCVGGTFTSTLLLLSHRKNPSFPPRCISQGQESNADLGLTSFSCLLFCFQQSTDPQDYGQQICSSDVMDVLKHKSYSSWFHMLSILFLSGIFPCLLHSCSVCYKLHWGRSTFPIQFETEQTVSLHWMR